MKPTEPLHVYDWLDLPAKDEAERLAKEWISKFCHPSYPQDHDWLKRHDFLKRYRLTVEWLGMRYTCSGASRMGDVWLKTEDSPNFYDHRVNVEELSHWKRLSLPLPEQPRKAP